ncbi:MAG: hypothetical protein GC159_05410 [Phycisphaera sp.]|nr:hypothetical protein [Phycisphaera sp.]
MIRQRVWYGRVTGSAKVRLGHRRCCSPERRWQEVREEMERERRESPADDGSSGAAPPRAPDAPAERDAAPVDSKDAPRD